jgi:pyridoxal phosphate enzyme (YggS family)
MEIEENIRSLRENIARIAEKVKRNPEKIEIVAVSKTVEVERIKEALKCGIKIIGENKVQEAEEKFCKISEKFGKHLVGHLQTNKVKKAIGLFDMIQSLDSLKLANEISKRALEGGKVMDVLVEVNTSGEESKFGLKPDEVLDFVKNISELKGIKVKGLMTVGLFTSDIQKARPCFKSLKGIFERIKTENILGIDMKYLSMGMTSDYEVAIEEGSNMLRIGTAIFGERKG